MGCPHHSRWPWFLGRNRACAMPRFSHCSTHHLAIWTAEPGHIGVGGDGSRARCSWALRWEASASSVAGVGEARPPQHHTMPKGWLAGWRCQSEVLANVHGNLCIPLCLVQGLHQMVYPQHDGLRQTDFHVAGQPLLQALQFLEHQRDVLLLERQTGRE